LATTILWIHATAGALWIGACACFVIAGLAMTPGSPEQRNLAMRASLKIDRLAILAAALLLLTGLVNLVEAAISRRFAFTTAFATVLAIKILLFIAMLATMRSSMKIGAVIRAVIERGRTDALPTALDRMVKAHAAIVAMGSIALLLGLWLIGS
jgi:putative copper export protein